jgi:hypothetical protein
LLEDTANIKKLELKDLMAKYYSKRKGICVGAGTGHLLEEMFQLKEKQLALSLSLDKFWSGWRAWTLWLSFGQPVDKSICEVINKAVR